MLSKRQTPASDKLICDFTSGAVRHRFQFGGGRGQALPRAVGLKNGVNPVVIDATAGLGRDAFLLASLGAEVTLIERSPIIYKLLKEGIARARNADNDVAEVIGRMTLLYGDARDLLSSLSPEVVLVDPMHPARNKSALVKNEMRLLRRIVGTDKDSAELMMEALASARKRVVLKWPLRAKPPKGIRPPSHQITGKSTRYDVFMTG